MADFAVVLVMAGLSLYVVFGALALWLLTRSVGQIPAEMPELSRYVGLLGSYAKGPRLAVLVLALVLYLAAVAALSDKSGWALSLFGAALTAESAAFFSWKGRRDFLNHLTPGERASEIAGLVGLASCLCVLAGLRHSGVLS
jgi:hypothetical protein